MLFIYNTLTKQKEQFIPIDEKNIKMYVCGPTVYDRPHIGNMRSVVIYDLLYRILKYLYPKVTYVRNITDVDDKIIERAKKENRSEQNLAKEIENLFNQDCKFLNCLHPTHTPRATEEIDSMIKMIQQIIDNGHGYIANNHVFFDVLSMENYGKLSGRNINEMQFDTQNDETNYKKNPMDFVLWKPAKNKEEISFESPFGVGRPGWHIECSAMSSKYLGAQFDIHGGGIDLLFPHHENEIIQSKACGNDYAKYWIHNGFLMFNREKMSKSLGNIKTITDLTTDGYCANTLRYALLSSSYLKPLDLNPNLLHIAKMAIKKFSNLLIDYQVNDSIIEIDDAFLSTLLDDVNTSKAFAILHHLADLKSKNKLYNCLKFIGFNMKIFLEKQIISDDILKLLEQRKQARMRKDFTTSDRIRDEIVNLGYPINDC